MDRCVEQAQRLFWEIKNLREQGACRLVTRKLVEMAHLHENRARELLARQDPYGWTDLYAAITAWAEAGCINEAFKLVREGRDLSSSLPEGNENVDRQLAELDHWIASLSAPR